MIKELNFSSRELELQNRFIELSTSLVEMLKTEGVKTSPYREGLPHFKELNAKSKEIVLERLKFYHDICLEHIVDGQPLRDSQKFTWRALVKLGLTPNSDLISRIEKDDIVEIYSDDQVQLFRNLEFFDYCSYTLEDLFCIEWWKLFKRDEKISESILTLAHDILDRKYPQGITLPFSWHRVAEVASRDKFNVDFLIKYLGPLHKNKQVAGIVCIEKGTIV